MKKFILLLGFIIASPFANAMDYKVIHKADNAFIFATGEIDTGDNKKLKAIFSQLKNKPAVVILNSDGGYVDEALEVGLTIHKYGANTAIGQISGKPGHCASACALIFFGGHIKFMGANDKLGVHQMSSTSSDARLTEMSAQYWTSMIYEYGFDVKIPRIVLKTMFNTFNHDMFYISPKAASQVGVTILK